MPVIATALWHADHVAALEKAKAVHAKLEAMTMFSGRRHEICEAVEQFV